MSLPTPPPTEATEIGSQRRGLWTRLRWVGTPFRYLWQAFSRQPRGFRLGLAVVLVIGTITGVMYAQIYLKKRESVHATVAAWQAYNTAAQKTDLDAMRAALDGVLAINSSDPNAGRYRSMIDRGEADPDSPELAMVLMTHHRGQDRLPEAAREAEKVLAKYPKHWLARCYLAHQAIQGERNPAKAEHILAQLPDPEDPEANVRLNGILYALRLFDATGRDATPLRSVVLRKLVPLTRSAAAANAEPAAKVQLVGCYLEPFADPTAITELGSYWAAADKLAEDAATEAIANGDIPTLIRLAELGPRMRIALTMLRNNDPARLPPERFDPLLKSIDDRTHRIWQIVRDKEPQRPESYRGLAGLALQNNDPAGAIRSLLDGLAICGDRPEFLELLVGLVARFGTDASIRNLADRMWKAAESSKTNPVKWCLAAEVALVVNRPDAAFLACRNARAIQPNNPWACATQARILVRSGKFLEAREALAALAESAILLNPALTRVHARILVGSGLWILRDEEFKKVTEAQSKFKSKSSLPAVAFLLGVLDAPPNAERAAWVAAMAELILSQYPGASGAALARAEALYRLADLSALPHPEDRTRPPVWNSARVTMALRAITQLSQDQRAEPNVIATVATLQLKGEGNAAAALRTVTPLLANESSATPAQLEILGAVLIANNRPAEAVRLLERVALSPSASAGSVVALAVAYEKNQQPIDARKTLALAENIPERTDREQAELIAAKLMLLKERP
ncbi:MAG: hypothetical protein C0467_16925 [Planctomycetaceae bacterium]|nr:hypothetical protein [Planctomycetaceae bacterium]